MITSDNVYLPIELNENNCVVFIGNDTIRVYDNEPIINTEVGYTDFLLNQHYLELKGTELIDHAVFCSDNANFTTAYYNRVDFDSIFLIFTLILGIFTYIIGKILHSLFLGFR